MRFCAPIPSVLHRITLVRLAGREVREWMWTEAHRARHEARLKDMVRVSAVGEIARWLERADPPRSPRRTPLRWIVAALAWHLRVGGPWRALPGGFPPWRTVYGWFRRWLEAGLIDALMRGIACLRRRAAPARGRPRASARPALRQSGAAGVRRGERGGSARSSQRATAPTVLTVLTVTMSFRRASCRARCASVHIHSLTSRPTRRTSVILWSTDGIGAQRRTQTGSQ